MLRTPPSGIQLAPLPPKVPAMPSLLKLAALPLIAVGVATMIGAGSHDEAALMSDWSAPPPWPIFIALNVLAGGLRAAADALTPPPIKMLDMAMAYHSTQLVHVAQRFEIPDLLAAEGPLTAAQIAAAIGSDADVVERVMYACAAQGVFRLARPEESKGHRFVNSPLSAVLRKDHPNSLRGMVGHNAEEGFAAWGKLADYVANPSGPNPWDLAMPKHPTSKGGVWDFFQKVREKGLRSTLMAGVKRSRSLLPPLQRCCLDLARIA